MKKSFFFFFMIVAILMVSSCKNEEDPTNDNPNVTSILVDSTLRSFYLKPSPGATFESIYAYTFPNVNCNLSINIYWYDPASVHGIYLHFNNYAGDILTDANGFVKAFDSGATIDSTTAGTWSGFNDGKFSLDYVSNPSADKGNLAGKGDKYIVFRAFSDAEPQFKFYGWMRVTVSANGRDVKVIAIGFQKNSNTALRTGEL